MDQSELKLENFLQPLHYAVMVNGFILASFFNSIDALSFYKESIEASSFYKPRPSKRGKRVVQLYVYDTEQDVFVERSAEWLEENGC